MLVSASAPRLDRHAGFVSRFLDRARDLVVYLPPGYDDAAQRRYPVLYMHDGQNLFDPVTAYVRGQHWRLGEMADMLIAEGRVQPLVIVGVNHTGVGRLQEYTPTRDPAAGRRDGQGLRPAAHRGAQAVYRRPLSHAPGTPAHRPGRFVAGRASSTLYSRAAPRRRVLAAGGAVAVGVVGARGRSCATSTRPGPSRRPASGSTSAPARAAWRSTDARRLREALVAAGWRDHDDLRYVESPGATHSEAAWGEWSASRCSC